MVLEKAVIEEKISPRDICVLFRQRVDRYSDALKDAVRAKGNHIRVRDESRLQELLSEPVVSLVVDAFWCRSISRSKT